MTKGRLLHYQNSRRRPCLTLVSTPTKPLSLFAENQDRFRSFVEDNFTPDMSFSFKSFKPFEDLTKQNLAAFEQAMQMFTPFSHLTPTATQSPTSKPAPSPEKETSSTRGVEGDQLDQLQEQLKAMQAQINNLQDTKK